MPKKITFRHMDSDQVIEDYANKHLEKIEKFLANEPSPCDIDLTFLPSKTREHHMVELRVVSPHYNLIAQHEHNGTDFYDAINQVIENMYHQILKAKEKRITERNHGNTDERIRE